MARPQCGQLLCMPGRVGGGAGAQLQMLLTLAAQRAPMRGGRGLPHAGYRARDMRYSSCRYAAGRQAAAHAW